MSLSDSDLELLENHLDGELSVADEEALRDRMNIEPELGAMLETLRSERDAAGWRSCRWSRTTRTVERFNGYASREIQRLDVNRSGNARARRCDSSPPPRRAW
jgi:hypothetical protein